jgi:hypothetical protein
MTFPFGEEATAWREVRDRFGDETVVDERTLHGVAFAPRVSSEPGTDRRTAIVLTGMTLYIGDPGPTGSGLDARWRVRRISDGTVWRVAGTPARWVNPFTGWDAGEQVELDRVEG